MEFSIIIPTYNRASHLGSAISSVLSQTHQDWELLVVDDGSTDNTQEIVTSFQDPRIHYYYQENAERSAARNKGVELAQGEWICFLDSDDYYLPNHLEKMVEVIGENPLKKMLLASGLLIEENGHRKQKKPLNTSRNPVREISEIFLIPTQVCIHRDLLVENRFDQRFSLWEDTHLWMRIAAKYPVIQTQSYTAIQVHHDTSTVNKGLRMVRIADVERYIAAISDLEENYKDLLKGKFEQKDFTKYIDSKYRMYLYQARQNRQLGTSISIWWKGFIHQPSFYFLSELPKIFLNKLGIGIHE